MPTLISLLFLKLGEHFSPQEPLNLVNFKRNLLIKSVMNIALHSEHRLRRPRRDISICRCYLISNFPSHFLISLRNIF
jgi:hypothetical protein